MKKRAATVSNILRKLATAVIAAIATLAVFNTLGIPIMPFLATAGVAGIAIAFGAQSLVKDFFRGFFLLAGNQIRQGDVVEIAGKLDWSKTSRCATCSCATTRATCISCPTATSAWSPVRAAPTRTRWWTCSSRSSSRSSRSWTFMQEVSAQLRAHATMGSKILEDLDIAGIENWDATGITLRARLKVQALEQANVKREFLLRLKQQFDEHRIRQPRNTVMMLDRGGQPRSAAPEGPPA